MGQAINSGSESPLKNEGTKWSNMDILPIGPTGEANFFLVGRLQEHEHGFPKLR